MNLTPMPGRRLLTALSAAAVLALAWLVPSAAATAQPTSPIRHVVVIYLENHSFDNVLGFWCQGHRARCRDASGKFAGMPASVTLSGGAAITPARAPGIVPGVRHTTADQAAAVDGGKMDGWDQISGCGPPAYKCVTGYKPAQVPNAAALAHDFAISDATFSMQDSPSWFAHVYAVAATTDGFTGNNPPTGTKPGHGWGCDSGKNATWAGGGTPRQVPSCIPDPALTGPGGAPLANGGAYHPTPVPYVPTILGSLNGAGLQWRIYGANCTSETVNASGDELCGASNGQYVWSICPSFAEYLYSGQCAGQPDAQGNGLVPDSQFVSDASSGKLAAFSVVTAGDFTTSEHNGASMTAGDNWLGKLVTAAEHGPEWNSTAIFITWDDCGCFYDQVPPGTNPDGTPQGPRVPLIIVSPYAKPGYTDTKATTFAGILAYTEHTFGLAALNANDARAYPFTNAFNYAQAPLRPATMVTRPLPPAARHIHLTPAELNDPS